MWNVLVSKYYLYFLGSDYDILSLTKSGFGNKLFRSHLLFRNIDHVNVILFHVALIKWGDFNPIGAEIVLADAQMINCISRYVYQFFSRWGGMKKTPFGSSVHTTSIKVRPI